MQLNFKSVVIAVAATLATTAAAQDHGGDEGPDPFNIAFQRYTNSDCTNPIGNRQDNIGRRNYVVNDGTCSWWKPEAIAHFSSFDYEWMPYVYYHADRAQDDPLATSNKDAKDGKSKHSPFGYAVTSMANTSKDTAPSESTKARNAPARPHLSNW